MVYCPYVTIAQEQEGLVKDKTAIYCVAGCK